MTDGQSRIYFERRAEQEQVAAQQAASESAAQRHREMAEQYRRLVLAGGPIARQYADTSGEGALPKDFRLIP
jgi:hypothetical protein